MFLVYTDESGKDFKKGKDGIYRDGPCFLYGGLAVDIGKYNSIENAFKLMSNEILGITNIYEEEIHTGDIFYGKGRFGNLDFNTKKEFFKEVLQLLAKFNIPLVLGIVYKDSNIFSTELEKQASAIYSFFGALDSFLLKEGKYGIIIADELEKDIKDIKTLLNINNLKGKRGGVKLSFLLRRIYFEKLHRFEEYNFSPLLPLRYKFESRIYAILDNIHYVNSKFSIFNQLSDIILFLVNILLEVAESTNSTEKEKLINEIKKDFKFYLVKTNSTISYLIPREKNFDVKFISFDIPPFNQDLINQDLITLANRILGVIKNMQANGT